MSTSHKVRQSPADSLQTVPKFFGSHIFPVFLCPRIIGSNCYFLYECGIQPQHLSRNSEVFDRKISFEYRVRHRGNRTLRAAAALPTNSTVMDVPSTNLLQMPPEFFRPHVRLRTCS